YWRGAIEDGPDLPAGVTGSTRYQTASLHPSKTRTSALAYAAESERPKPVQAPPLGGRPPPPPPDATALPAQGSTTIGAKPVLSPAQASAALPIDSPWLRAAMLTPSFSTSMSATQLGAVDMRPLQELFYKPSHSLAMPFSAAPQLGLVPSSFNGPAGVFLATPFAPQSTAGFAMQIIALR